MVKCAHCGLLALRNHQSRELCEAESEWRTTGKFPHGDTWGAYSGPPICIAAKETFSSLSPVVGSCYSGFDEITKERECDSFIAWQQGFKPKEHIIVKAVNDLLAWRTNEEKAARDWRQAQAKRERKWRQQDTKRAARALKIHMGTILLAALVGGILGIGGRVVDKLLSPSNSPSPRSTTAPCAQDRGIR